MFGSADNKQFYRLRVFVISGIIRVEVSVIS